MRRARRSRRGSGARGGRPKLKQVGGKRLPARSSSARERSAGDHRRVAILIAHQQHLPHGVGLRPSGAVHVLGGEDVAQGVAAPDLGDSVRLETERAGDGHGQAREGSGGGQSRGRQVRRTPPPQVYPIGSTPTAPSQGPFAVALRRGRAAPGGGAATARSRGRGPAQSASSRWASASAVGSAAPPAIMSAISATRPSPESH